MNVNVQGLRRNVKNVVRNYTDAQVKVREATSNDHWGPPSALMGEIADLSYNVVAFTEIMQIVWKRLNDNGKNWRHVYKALVLLEYLIKVGSERVATQCRENIFAIQTLKDFQYVEDNKDQGMNVREKSKQLVSLLKDDERLRQERTRALKAKERFAQNTNIGTSSEGGEGATSRREDLSSPRDLRTVLGNNSELESARPQTAGEEELQLQLALAMSKEEAEQDERQRKNDDLRLQMALTESQQEKLGNSPSVSNGATGGPSYKSCMDDLLGLNLGGAAAAAVASQKSSDPWGNHGTKSSISPVSAPPVETLDPWAPASAVAADPWAPQPATQLPPTIPSNDPWAISAVSGGVSKGEMDEFDLISRQRLSNMSPMAGQDQQFRGSLNNSPAFDMSGLGGALPKTSNGDSAKMRKTPESFLGPNSNLVNLDALVTTKPVVQAAPVNPFGGNIVIGGNVLNTSPAPPQQNPFQALNKPPTMNELRGSGPVGFEGDFASSGTTRASNAGSVNPFL